MTKPVKRGNANRRGRATRERAVRGTPAVGREIELEIGAVAHGGFCVGRHEGRAVFVRHTLPGEKVRAVVTEGGSEDRFWRADAIEILRANEHRVTPPCPYAGPGRCGGCDWQHASLDYQRELKSTVVREQLDRLAGLELVDDQPVVEPVPGDEDGLRWRTRVEFAVDEAGRAGMRAHRSHAVIPIDDCLIATRPIIESGVLSTTWTDCAAVEVVDASLVDDAVVVPIAESGKALDHAGHGVESTVGERVQVGEWVRELAVDARGFWQVHPGAAPTLVDEAMALLDPQEGERALDVFAGVGLFAAALADLVGEQGQVLAVESDGLAVENAVENLEENPWASARQGRADRVLAELVRDGETFDLVVLDPPRTGAGRQVIESLVDLEPRAVVYVACDPAALARDVAIAEELGYQLVALRAFDAFPMTQHVECVALLEPVDESDLESDPESDHE
ncbi:methyltransferase [Arsenicicoccus piscis]|uniref:RNA methyltransferase n=1 Tax=Arsenicicoccus piscis TaxID=673954 RepID=A0ABQ6HPB2_9MICO|nr:TRAM domain-containing protein [Arsenicicoccus piscis]MCH8628904.1 methyltransferase [Arsenicicoccus piscis]GMA19508.1 putative RNA methyltransferase [Arsenicicoccus piscis]